MINQKNALGIEVKMEETKKMRTEKEFYEEILGVMHYLETQMTADEKIRKLYNVDRLLQYEQEKWDALWNYLQEKIKPKEETK